MQVDKQHQEELYYICSTSFIPSLPFIVYVHPPSLNLACILCTHIQVLSVVKGHRLRAEREPHFLARLKEEYGQVPEWSLQVE